MAGNLSMLLKAGLDTVGSKSQIDEQIKILSSKLSHLNLKIDIDPKVLKELTNFSEAIDKMNNMLIQQNETIRKNITVTKELDGSIKTVVEDIRRNGEVVVTDTTKTDKNTQAKQRQIAVNKELALQQMTLIKENIKSTNGVIGSQTNTYQDDFVTKAVTTIPNGLTTDNTTNNIGARANAGIKAEQQIQNAQQKTYDEYIKDEKSKTAYLEKYELVVDRMYNRQIQQQQESYQKWMQDENKIISAINKQDMLQNEMWLKYKAQMNSVSNPNSSGYMGNSSSIYSQRSILDATNANFSTLNSSARESASVFENLFNRTSVATQGLSAIENQTRTLNPMIENTTAGTARMGQSWFDAGKKMLQWAVIGGILFGTIRQISQAFSFVADLDKSMTNIQMITGKSRDEVVSLTKEYSNLASQLHETTSAIMTASEEFLRAGNNSKDTTSLLQASTVMSKIAGQSQQDSAQSLIAIMNAFHMNANEMMGVVDKMVAVDNTSATSTSELSKALNKTSSSAQAAGVNLSQLISYIGTISSITRQNPESIGTSLNVGGLIA
ncbi:MAG TPA: phage tail tape measure protein [Candidatus Paceibacterota bacterium]